MDLTYISPNISDDEALRLYGDALPAGWRERIECGMAEARDYEAEAEEARAELSKADDREKELEGQLADLEDIVTSLREALDGVHERAASCGKLKSAMQEALALIMDDAQAALDEAERRAVKAGVE